MKITHECPKRLAEWRKNKQGPMGYDDVWQELEVTKKDGVYTWMTCDECEFTIRVEQP